MVLGVATYDKVVALNEEFIDTFDAAILASSKNIEMKIYVCAFPVSDLPLNATLTRSKSNGT